MKSRVYTEGRFQASRYIGYISNGLTNRSKQNTKQNTKQMLPAQPLQAAYQRGIKSEQKVIEALKATKSNDEQNFYEDIDYTIGNNTYSLKTQNTALRTGNIAFELTNEQANGTVQNSWYYNGKADYYHFLIGSELYEVASSDVKDYVFMHGFDCEKSLGFSARQSQLAISHSHVNSVCGLINATKLIKAGILVKIAVIH